MEKGDFVFNFFSKKIVLLFLGEEILALSKTHLDNEPISIPLEWYKNALEIWKNRILN